MTNDDPLNQNAWVPTVEGSGQSASRQATPNVPADYLGALVHEIRCGLQIVLGHSQLVIHGRFDDVTVERSSEALHRAGAHLISLLDDASALARLHALAADVHLEPIEVNDALAEAVEFARGMERPSGVDISVDCPSNLLALASPRHLRQILLNLLTNALKYNRPNGSVLLRCARQGPLVRIEIADTGTGIAAPAQQTVFDPYQRGPGTMNLPGHGIGLTIARALACSMGGSMELVSTSDSGSTFALWLPASESAGAAKPVAH